MEKTYLAKELPKNLKDCDSKEIIDIYIPKASVHPSLRLRKNGDKFEMTKKEPIKAGDASIQLEQTIVLTEEEFVVLADVEGKKTHKIRYYYDYAGRAAEIDVFQDRLSGLVLVDVEFENETEKDSFEMPDFCLADITQESFTAGGMICGKSYDDIAEKLNVFGYKKIFNI